MSSRSQRYWILLLGAIIALGPLTIDTYLPSLPTIQKDLSTTATAVQLTISAYFIGLAISQLVWGWITDRFGRRRPLLTGMLLYSAASFACAFAPNIGVLIGARVVQALGGAAGVVIVRAIVRDLWSGRDIARVMSSLILVMGVAPVVAPSLGGALLAAFGWRAIFVLLGAAGALAFALVSLSLTETASDGEKSESALRAAGRVLTDRTFLAYALSGSFSMAGIFCYISGAPFVFIDIYELSPTWFAVLFGANAAGFVIASQINRVLLQTRDHINLLRAALVCTVVSGTGLAWAGWAVAPLWLLLPVLFLYMSTIGFTLPNTTAAAMDPHGPRAGIASALLGTLQYGIAALSSAGTSAFAQTTPRPMVNAMLLNAVLAISCLLIAPRRTPVI